MEIASKHVTLFKQRVTGKGKDANGMPFPAYSDAYLDKLQNDFRDESGKRLEGYEGLALDTSAQKISKRLFNLRGLTMRNLRVRRVKGDWYMIGWDGEAAQIVEQNQNRRKKRDIASDIPNDEFNRVVQMFGKVFDDEMRAVRDKTIYVGR